MVTVEVSQNGTELGKVRFRDVAANAVDSASAVPSLSKPKRLYQCKPEHCVPKHVVQEIAQRLSSGVQSGQTGDYDWHT